MHLKFRSIQTVPYLQHTNYSFFILCPHKRRRMALSLHTPFSSPSQHLLLNPTQKNPLHAYAAPKLPLGCRTKPQFSRSLPITRAILSVTKEAVLEDFRQKKALKIISGLQNYNRDNVASVITAADKGGATHVDIACDPELVKLAVSLTSLPICVSSVDPLAFLAAVEAGATMVEIGNYDSFYEMGRFFSPDEILQLTKETRELLPSLTLSVTVPHTISLPEQAKLAELLEQEGADIIQTEGGKCSSPSKPGVLGLIEKATPTLAAAYAISRAVKIPVLCSSGLSAVTAPMAITAGAAGVGVGSAVNKLDNVLAMIAEVRSIADALASNKMRANVNVDREKTLGRL